jgi:hypothetical protein
MVENNSLHTPDYSGLQVDTSRDVLPEVVAEQPEKEHWQGPPRLTTNRRPTPTRHSRRRCITLLIITGIAIVIVGVVVGCVVGLVVVPRSQL